MSAYAKTRASFDRMGIEAVRTLGLLDYVFHLPFFMSFVSSDASAVQTLLPPAQPGWFAVAATGSPPGQGAGDLLLPARMSVLLGRAGGSPVDGTLVRAQATS